MEEQEKEEEQEEVPDDNDYCSEETTFPVTISI